MNNIRPNRYRLSKSRLMDFLQCPKKLYLRIHHPELAEDSAGAMQNFQVGHEVGDVARNLYTGSLLKFSYLLRKE